MRSTQDPIRGLQRYIEEWGLASEQELKQLDKDAKAEVDAAVAEAKESPEPLIKDLWTDIYYKGTEPPSMRGREREEVSLQFFLFFVLTLLTLTIIFTGSPLLDLTPWEHCFYMHRAGAYSEVEPFSYFA